MPLAELLRMLKGKLDASQLKASTSDDPSCRPDADCVELIWENGQIGTQGQSSKASKGHDSNNLQSLVPRQEDNRTANSLKTTKMNAMDTVLTEFPLSVPSSEMGLDQDVDLGPWLNYAIQDTLHNDYTSDFLRELSGVTLSDLPREHHLVSKENRSGFSYNDQSTSVNNVPSLKQGNPLKGPSSAQKHTSVGSSEVRQFSLPIQHNVSTSGSSGITGINTSSADHVTSQESMANPSSSFDFTSLQLQKLDAGQPTTSPGFTNFPYFSRPAAIARANQMTERNYNKVESDDMRCTLSYGAHSNSTEVKESFPAKPMQEPDSSNQAACEEDVTMKNTSENQVNIMSITKARMDGEKNKEPVFTTSSVCSGNCVQRNSYAHPHDLKRKAPENGESEGPSDDADEESVGARKAAPSKTGTKRSRAAEVHNLSERRRRDRINEKMRALQELIPNCNKVDKASMLDEAIEYLKTLQLQVQMLSMGAGLYMQPMVVPPGMQSIHGAQMPHFSPMGVGMGMGMGFGMNMLDVNSGLKLMPFQGPQYPVVGRGPPFHVMPGSSLQPLAHPAQGLTMPVSRPPVLPGIPPLKLPMAANVSGAAGSINAATLATSSNPKDGLQSIPSNNVNSSVNSASNQAANQGIETHPPSREGHDRVQAVNNTTGASGSGD